MKKLILILSLVLIMTGCTTKKEEPQNLSILSPKGATTVSLAEIINNGTADVKTVDGTDIITSELVREDSEYDIIIAPINLGAKLISEGKSSYILSSVLTWGNLYVTKVSDYDATDCKMAAFGENAVPQIILNNVLSKKGIGCEIEYFNSAADVNAALLSGKYKMGMVAEPAYTLLKSKGQEKNIVFETYIDLQEEWDHGRYPQAAVFVKEETYKNNKKVFDEFKDVWANSIISMNDNPSMLETIIGTDGNEIYGVPNGKIASISLEGQNISLEGVYSVYEEVQNFLNLFNISLSDSNIIK